MIKMICLLKRKAPLTHEAFLEHWLKSTGRSPVRRPAFAATCSPDITETQSPSRRAGLAIEIDGIAELWFDDYRSMSDSQYDEGMQRLLAYGATFIGEIKNSCRRREDIVPARPR